MPTAAQEGTTLHRTFACDSYGEIWTDELEGRPLHHGTPLELLMRGRWVPVLYLRDSHVSTEGPRAYLRYRKSKQSVPLLLDRMHLRWPPPAPSKPVLPSCTWWGDLPEGWVTKTVLKAEGLRPGGEPVATIRYGRRGHSQETVVQGGAQAVPRKTATPAQLAALEKAQEVRKKKRACEKEETVYFDKDRERLRRSRCKEERKYVWDVW